MHNVHVDSSGLCMDQYMLLEATLLFQKICYVNYTAGDWKVSAPDLDCLF